MCVCVQGACWPHDVHDPACLAGRHVAMMLCRHAADTAAPRCDNCIKRIPCVVEARQLLPTPTWHAPLRSCLLCRQLVIVGQLRQVLHPLAIQHTISCDLARNGLAGAPATNCTAQRSTARRTALRHDKRSTGGRGQDTNTVLCNQAGPMLIHA